MIDDDDQTLDTGVYDVYIVLHLKSFTVVTIDLLTATQNLSYKFPCTYYQCRIILSLFYHVHDINNTLFISPEFSRRCLSHVEQELITLPEHMVLSHFFNVARI